ncbi:MAG: diacylglycerol kinase family lipid kinase [Firmicutes bacterium]|nr:diacylglycerol kinase family lipid kinase [Bacillota bacterium]
MKVAFIVNPLAGRGRARKIWEELEPRLKIDAPYEVYFTEKAGDAVQLARRAQEEGAEVLVSVGGDGTVHEIVNGMDLQKGTLGFIPAGTGNDFCRSLHYPQDPFAVAEQLFSWERRRVDLGKMGHRYFVNVIGTGFDAQVAYDVNKRFKRLTGLGAYLAAVLKNLVTYRNAPLEIEYDGHRWSGKALLIAIGNGGYYGGGIRIVPPAEPDDGWFHICLAMDMGKLETLRLLPAAISGGHEGHRKVILLKARRISVRSSAPLAIQADGELLGTLPLTVVGGAAGPLRSGPGRERGGAAMN